MRLTNKTLAAVVALGWAWLGPPAHAASIQPGASNQTVRVGDYALAVFVYRPACSNPALLLVFHGDGRKAEQYRDATIPVADRLCMIVVAPLFSKSDFPGWKYQRGGIVHADAIVDPRRWTGRIVLDLVAWVREQEQRELDYYLLGHSAGGQFLSRVAAFVPTDAKRIVIANPSTYVLPSLTIEAPYGLGGVYAGAGAEAELRRYLAQPVTIYLGAADVGDKNRNDSSQARSQGANRYERGLNAYRAGEQVAASRGWPFRWRLVVVPGVGHSASKMFGSPELPAALAP